MSTPEPTLEEAPSLLDLAEGFLALPRRLCGSALFDSLRADERYVVVTLLLRAQWGPGEFYFGGIRFPLAPGQLIDSEQSIADAAGSSRKVVRTVIRKMAGAGLITRTRAHPAGQCPHVTTIIGYGRILFDAAAPGPRTGQPLGHEGATKGPADGPVTGHEGAPSEQGNKGNKETQEQGNLLPSPTARRRKAGDGGGEGSRHHAVIALFCRLWTELRGGTYRVATAKDGAAVKQLLGYPEATDDEIERRMRVAFADPFFVKAGGLAFFVSKWSTWEPPKIAPRAATNGAPVPAKADGYGTAGGMG